MMESFYEHCPELADKETRSVTLLWQQNGLAAGEYAFLELYCTEPGCSCGNVLIHVVERSRGHLATINHGLDPDEFKDVRMPQTYLDPLNKQTKYSPALLELFINTVLDKTYKERLHRHLAMIKDKVHRDNEGVILRKNLPPQQRLGRFIEELKSMPCPCGSGRPCVKCDCKLSRAKALRRMVKSGVRSNA